MTKKSRPHHFRHGGTDDDDDERVASHMDEPQGEPPEPAPEQEGPVGGLTRGTVGVDANGDVWHMNPDGSYLKIGSVPKPEPPPEAEE